jgi:hypothetical protein
MVDKVWVGPIAFTVVINEALRITEMSTRLNNAVTSGMS